MAENRSTVIVEGLAPLRRAWAAADKAEARALTKTLREAAEPVRVDAEANATGRIASIGAEWSQMRVGTVTGAVYVAPRARGGDPTRSRPKFAGLLLDRAMIPALEANVDEVERRVDEMLGEVGRVWETTA